MNHPESHNMMLRLGKGWYYLDTLHINIVLAAPALFAGPPNCCHKQFWKRGHIM